MSGQRSSSLVPSALTALALLAVASGCGGSKPPEPAAAPPSPMPTAAVTTPSPTPNPTPPPSPSPTPADPESATFDRVKQEVLGLEENAELSQAIRRAREAEDQSIGHPRLDEIREISQRLRQERAQLTPAQVAMAKLTADDSLVATVARDQIVETGDVGRILLRKAIREGGPDLAVVAADILYELRDPRASGLLVARLSGEPPGPSRDRLLHQLALMGGPISPESAGKLWDSFIRSPSPPLASALVRLYANSANGDEAAFGKLVMEPRALTQLKDYVDSLRQSPDAGIRARGFEISALLGLHRQGLKAEYFTGTGFNVPLVTRLDARIHYPDDGTLNLPEGRVYEISATWTGQVVIPRDGTYTFHSTSDDGQRVYINGKRIIDDWNAHGMTLQSATVDLKAGAHDYRHEWFQGGGGAGIIAEWEGPGIPRQIIPPEAFRVLPWPGLK